MEILMLNSAIKECSIRYKQALIKLSKQGGNNMNYHNITKTDMLNGEGVRVVLWLSGCEHKCKNCQNPQTWNHDSGIPFDEEARQELFKAIDKDYITGVTLSGGDPLSRFNRNEVLPLAIELKTMFPDKTIWCYTGYKWEDVKDLFGIQYIDVLVDGKYVEELNTPSPKWCGSTNQRIIDVKKSLETGGVVLYETM